MYLAFMLEYCFVQIRTLFEFKSNWNLKKKIEIGIEKKKKKRKRNPYLRPGPKLLHLLGPASVPPTHVHAATGADMWTHCGGLLVPHGHPMSG
jgi:hypothetical protein